MKHRKQGYSLVEVSISMIIIGLLVGGVLVGTTMIRTAELVSVISEVESYKKAIGSFKDKYKQLPGDFSRATQFWGSSTAATTGIDANGANITSCGALAVMNTPQTPTCDGNGDGLIGGESFGPMGVGTLCTGEPGWRCFTEDLFQPAGSPVPTAYGDFRESALAWQHLANAGLIPGSYSGGRVTIPAGNDWWRAGVNMPKSKIRDNGYSLSYSLDKTAADQRFDIPAANEMGVAGSGYSPDIVPAANYGHVIVYGSTNYAQANNSVRIDTNTPTLMTPNGPGLTSEEALLIDSKMDDGLPTQGNVLSFIGKHPNGDIATANGFFSYGQTQAAPTITSNTPDCIDPDTNQYQNIAGADTNLPTCALIFITGF